MGDWNEQAVPNNNITPEQLRYAHKKQRDHEFSEELSDGGERDAFIRQQQKGFKL
ncbi:MAG: hypothetical protein ACE3JP_00255 [Ectobacillus sp.]